MNFKPLPEVTSLKLEPPLLGRCGFNVSRASFNPLSYPNSFPPKLHISFSDSPPSSGALHRLRSINWRSLSVNFRGHDGTCIFLPLPISLRHGSNLSIQVGAWFWGVYSDARGRTPAFNLTLLVTSIFGVLSAFAPGFGWLCLALFGLGTGVGGSMPTDGTL